MSIIEDEEVWAECSDDEKYNPGYLKKGTWEPKPKDILRLLEEIKTKKVLPLSWRCPGRRPPESEEAQHEVAEDKVENEPTEEEKKPMAPNEFDFDDSPQTKTILTPRRTPGSAPRSERKIAKLDKVLKDMMYQRKLQAAEREARKLIRSPRALGSPSRARLGSPAGSPRTPPMAGANRQSPVRMPSSDPLATPVRAPVHTDIMRTPVTNPVISDTPSGEVIPSKPMEVTQHSPAVTVSGGVTSVDPPTLQTPELSGFPGRTTPLSSQGTGEVTGDISGSEPSASMLDEKQTAAVSTAVSDVPRKIDSMDTS